MASAVNLVALRPPLVDVGTGSSGHSFFVVDPNEERNGGEGAHGGRLGVYLGDVGEALGKLGHGDGISVLEGEVGGLVPCALNNCLGIGEQAGAEAPNPRGDLVDTGDRGRVHEAVRDLLLRHNHCRRGAPHCDAGKAARRIGRLEGVFYLVQSPLRREDGDVVVIIAAFCGGGSGGVVVDR